ncbi:hypothetical protein [Aliikangiella coralliicola]|uniref:Uncharacterized protein n=1 Tax=Aliikangiella coralliicola TaxID=2592383 RepID=A0A545UFT0_9GAMM|nr:hypothetical protein [Aliikangiella coralliicola]TQV88336.1 hypothetical protein FLL46_07365 [Aliikangiella coralliicola]
MSSYVPIQENLNNLWERLFKCNSAEEKINLIAQDIGENWLTKQTTNGKKRITGASEIVCLESLNPGDSTRIALIFELLFEQEKLKTSSLNQTKRLKIKSTVRENIVKRARQIGSQKVTAKKLEEAASWRRKKKQQIKLTPALIESIGEEVNEKIRSRNKLPPIAPLEFFTRRFDSENAISEFVEWIAGTPSQQKRYEDSQIHLVLDQGPIYDERIQKLEQIASALRDNIRLINIHCEDQFMGLSAVMRNLRTLIHNVDERIKLAPICYLNLSKTPGYHEPVDVPLILSQIQAFYQIKNSKNILPPCTDAEIETAIREIRAAMLGHPSILIFDGLRCKEDHLPELQTAIRDDDFHWVLDRLTEPLLHRSIDETQWDTFNQCTIIVTSDLQIKDHKGAKKTSLHNSFCSIPWPKPSAPALWHKIIPELGLNNEKWVNDAFLEVKRMAMLGSENLAWILDTCVSVVEGEKTKLDELLHDLKVTSTKQKDCPELLQELKLIALGFIWNNLADKPIWKVFLIFLAISPSGVRASTFDRTLAEWKRILDCGSFQFNLNDFRLYESDTDISIEKQLREFEQIFNKLVTRKQRDYVPGYDGDIIEYSLEESRQGLVSLSGNHDTDFNSDSFDLILFEFKAYLVELISREYSYNVCRLAHRVLAEEAMRQQTIAFKRSSTETLSSLRGYRRQLEVLYHGYLSLPVLKEEEDEYPIDANPDLLSVIPSEALAAWYYLTKFCYIYVLERSNFSLCRKFGADEIKLELVKLAYSPGQFRESSNASVFNDGKVYFREAKKTPALYKRLRISWLQAALSVGRGLDEYYAFQDEFKINAFANSDLSGGDALLLSEKSHKYFKFAIDVMNAEPDHKIVKDEYHAYYGRIRKLLEQRLRNTIGIKDGSSQTELEAYIYSQSQLLEFIFNRHNFESFLDVRQLASRYSQKVCSPSPTQIANQVFELIGYKKSRNVVDLLNRIAETISNEALLIYREEREKGGSEEKTRKLRYDYARSLILSFSFLRQAEALRLKLFSNSAYGDANAISGSSARLMIRIALSLESQSRTQHNVNAVGYFGRRARRMSDIVCRYLFDFPRERASMLIVESSMIRTLEANGNGNNLESLLNCLHLLSNAEEIVESLDYSTRLRLEFKHERFQVLLALAYHYRHLKNEEQSKFYFELAKYDECELSNLASNQPNNLLFWKLCERNFESRIEFENSLKHLEKR